MAGGFTEYPRHVRERLAPGGSLDGRIWQMLISKNARSAEAIHRKLRAIAAVLLDPAATEHERANAEGLKVRLEKQLAERKRLRALPTWQNAP